jgi:hypothetical protein
MTVSCKCLTDLSFDDRDWRSISENNLGNKTDYRIMEYILMSSSFNSWESPTL